MSYLWNPELPSWAINSDGSFYRLWRSFYIVQSSQPAVLQWNDGLILCIEDRAALSYPTVHKLTAESTITTTKADLEWRRKRYRQVLNNVGLTANILLSADRSLFHPSHKDSLDEQLQKLCYFIKRC